MSSFDFSIPTALAFGSEHAGASRELIDSADGCFILPMHGFVQSLNVSVACALSMAQGRKLREDAIGATSDLSADEQQEMVKRWTLTWAASRIGRSTDEVEHILSRNEVTLD